MELVHTLLFMLREDTCEEDLKRAELCFKSLEKSAYNSVVVFNQGFWSNEKLQEYLKSYKLDCTVIGDGTNKGIVVGRQCCFEHIWKNIPSAFFISELHMDMIFTYDWEVPLVEYLKHNDEPMICCGIIVKSGTMPFLSEKVEIKPDDALNVMDDYLAKLKRDKIVYGFTHPCIHRSHTLKAVGGYSTHFLTGKQAYEDDSLLLAYYYYYGTRTGWKPKINYQSVVYHEVAGQRLSLNDNEMINFHGLIKQYGAMGLHHLSYVHQDPSHIAFFARHHYYMKRGGK